MDVDATKPPSIRDRIRIIAAEQGGPTALAHKAGLAPSTVAQYLSEERGRASMPGLEALIKLADASHVSITWLAAGRGPRNPDFLPDGYQLFPYFDLRVLGWRIHGLSGSPAEWVALKRSWFNRPERPGRPPQEIQCISTPDDNFSPLLKYGDLIAIDRSAGGGYLPLNFAEGALYAIAPEARILLRRLHWERDKGFVARAGMHGKLIKLEAFQIIGQIIWRSGPV